MKIPFRTLFTIILLILIIGAAGFLGYRMATIDRHTEVTKEVLLEKVNHVVKLGTVEGNFSEIYDYSDIEFYNFLPGILNFIPYSRKKALVRLKAKVLIGYDLDSLNIDVQPLHKKIIIGTLPNPEIISVDHNLEYYDIENGYFNKFSEVDFNLIQKEAKAFIREKALDSSLTDTAEKQLRENLDLLNWALKDAGWQIVINSEEKPTFLN